MDFSRNKFQLQLGLQISIWLLLILGYTLVFNRFIPLQFSLLRGIGNILPIIVLFYGNLFLVKKYFIPKAYGTYLLWGLLLFIFVTIIRTKVNLIFIDYKLDFLPETNQQFIGAAALISNLGVFFISTIFQLLIHRNEEEKKALLATNEHQEAQLQFLRAQINPHFLFNTLNNIYALAVVKSDKTAPMVLQLSELLRYVVYDSQEEKVALKKEVAQIVRFIELFQMKQETPLSISLQSTNIPDHLRIEPMILIPLVENCFKHCDFDSNPNAFVELKVQLEENKLHFSSRNSKNDQDQQKDKTGGVGLQNIQKRLALKYPNQHQMTIENQTASFFVDLTIAL